MIYPENDLIAMSGYFYGESCSQMMVLLQVQYDASGEWQQK